MQITPQSSFLPQHPNNSLLRKKKSHSNVNDGLLLHTGQLVFFVRHGKDGGKMCDSQGKSWPTDSVFVFLHPLLFCNNKPCCQLTTTLAAMNTHPQENIQFATMTLGSPSNLTGSFACHRMQYKQRMDFWRKVGQGLNLPLKYSSVFSAH